MKLNDILQTASSNMFRSKLRTLLTILAIFIGAFTLTITNGIGAGISSYIDKQVNTIGQKDVINISVKAEDGASLGDDTPKKYDATKADNTSAGALNRSVLTEADIKALEGISLLSDVQPSYFINANYISAEDDDKYKVSISPIGSNARLDLAAGSQLTNASENQIVIPVNYLSVLDFTDAQSAIGKQITIGIADAFGSPHTITATIVGVQQKGLISSSGAAINNKFTKELYDIQTAGLPDAAKNKFASATARIQGELSPERISDVKSQLNKLDFVGTTTEDTLGAFQTVISTLTTILNAFAVITLLAASFGIVNTLLMSVQERTKEIGLMKAMGMRSSRIFLLFSSEAVLIGFWGSVIGVVLAIITGQIVNAVLADGLLADLPGLELLVFTAPTVAGTILLIMAIAFLSGTLPARKASKQNPIDALRYE